MVFFVAGSFEEFKSRAVILSEAKDLCTGAVTP
jgi:hypothetical protein